MRLISSSLRHLTVQIRRVANDPSIVQKDILYLTLKAGNGGNGIQRYNGIGGNGGSIYIKPTGDVVFSDVCERYRHNRLVKGIPGTNSMQIKLSGKHADPTVITVPFGVECVNADTRMLLARCVNRGKHYLIAKGGDGGSHLNMYRGQKGAKLRIAIHFKLTTNIGFVGLPNAGKSTLLKAMAPERHVKIADYPFTTLKPQVFDINFDEKDAEKNESEDHEIFSLSVADLPGIIEGASRNRGCGYAFLKHLEYSEVIIMVVDVHGFKLSIRYDEPFRNALESIAILNKEIETYDVKLLKKPIILVLNKIDLGNGKEKADEISSQLAQYKNDWSKLLPKELEPTKPIKFKAVLSLSAKEGDITELKTILRQIYDELHPIEHVKGIDQESEEKSDTYVV